MDYWSGKGKKVWESIVLLKKSGLALRTNDPFAPSLIIKIGEEESERVREGRGQGRKPLNATTAHSLARSMIAFWQKCARNAEDVAVIFTANSRV